MAISHQYFVYVYRDLGGNPIYFGQGFGTARPADHLGGSHNPELDEWLRQNPGRYRLQIMGPLGSKPMADAVETALISACRPASNLTLMNVHPGSGAYSFRSYGAPETLAHRIAEPCGAVEIEQVVRQTGPVMFVLMHQKEHRFRFDPANPPPDDLIRQRMQGSWQIGKYRTRWIDDPTTSPKLLVAVTGVGGSQIIVAAAAINQAGWPTATKESGNLFVVPLVPDSSLDAAGLRGRPIRGEFGLKFGRARYEHFRLFGSNGFTTD